MRPTEAERFVRLEIQRILKGNLPKKYKMLSALHTLLDKQEIDAKKGGYGFQKYYDWEHELDGYSLVNSTMSTLSYISDRFNCDFRCAWLRDMVINNMFTGINNK